MSLTSLLYMSGCGRQPEDLVSYPMLLQSLQRGDHLALMEHQDSGIITSYDRSGGNDDFNWFLRDGPAGWKVIADLSGPGYLTRFWSTTSKIEGRRLRFYFDGASKPAWEGSLDEWMGGTDRLPLMGREPYCWFSLLPVPYRKRLIVMTEALRDDEKFYFQLNYVNLPEGKSIASFKPAWLEQYKAELDALKATWQSKKLKTTETDEKNVPRQEIAAGTQTTLLALNGPAIVHELTLQIDDKAAPSALARDRLLRELVLEIRWDDCPHASVAVPVGDFFGNMWRELRYRSAYFGWEKGRMYNRFPMPFARSMRVTLRNESARAIGAALGVRHAPLASWTGEYGYFHSAWLKTTPHQIGSPHPILNVRGTGKYVGCLLGVRSFDDPRKTWWALESDEVIYLDGASTPSWHGTGLEDYFNGGWYYANALASPFHGMPFKVPYNNYQYRIHQADPIFFTSSFDMIFERGPNHVSPVDMESAAFYYLTEPQHAPSTLAVARQPEITPLDQYVIMHLLLNYEVFNDWPGAIHAIDAFLEKYQFPFKAALLERKEVYMKGRNTAPPDKGLLGIYCNMPSTVFLDGKLVGQANDDKRMLFFDVDLPPGEHVIAARAQWRPYPSWFQLALKTPDGIIGTDGSWKCAFNPTGDWFALDYDDSAWYLSSSLRTKGPPIEPYVWLEPNREAGLHGTAWGISPGRTWPEQKGFVVYRKRFKTTPGAQ